MHFVSFCLLLCLSLCVFLYTLRIVAFHYKLPDKCILVFSYKFTLESIQIWENSRHLAVGPDLSPRTGWLCELEQALGSLEPWFPACNRELKVLFL